MNKNNKAQDIKVYVGMEEIMESDLVFDDNSMIESCNQCMSGGSCEFCYDAKYEYYSDDFWNNADVLFMKGKRVANIMEKGNEIFIQEEEEDDGVQAESLITLLKRWYNKKGYDEGMESGEFYKVETQEELEGKAVALWYVGEENRKGGGAFYRHILRE